MKSWIAHQARAIAGTLARLVRTPLSTAFNVVVVAVALALPTALYVLLVNVQTAARAAAPEPQVTLFMALDAGRADVRSVEERLRRHEGVAGVRFVPRDVALENLRRSSGLAGIAEGLGGNPLPDAFVVTAREAGAPTLERLRTEFAAYPKVDLVQVDTEWAQRLDALVKLGRIALAVLAALLAFALVAVTFNTIRLQILTQRDEIEVASLIGATPAFIRRPFLYYGAMLGLLGGAAACGLVAVALHLLNDGLAELARLYGSEWTLRPLGARDVASLLVFAASLGWVGAWLSVSRHLHADHQT